MASFVHRPSNLLQPGGLHAHDRAVDTVQSFAATVVPMSRMLWSLSSMPRRSSRQETSATVPVSGPTDPRRVDQRKGVEPIHQKRGEGETFLAAPRLWQAQFSCVLRQSERCPELLGHPQPCLSDGYVRLGRSPACDQGGKQKAPGLGCPRSGRPGTPKTLARLAGLEPATSRVETGCSIQLSYRRRRSYCSKCLPCGRIVRTRSALPVRPDPTRRVAGSVQTRGRVTTATKGSPDRFGAFVFHVHPAGRLWWG